MRSLSLCSLAPPLPSKTEGRFRGAPSVKLREVTFFNRIFQRKNRQGSPPCRFFIPVSYRSHHFDGEKHRLDKHPAHQRKHQILAQGNAQNQPQHHGHGGHGAGEEGHQIVGLHGHHPDGAQPAVGLAQLEGQHSRQRQQHHPADDAGGGQPGMGHIILLIEPQGQ